MKISFVSTEIVPFVKTGGLADVLGSLPNALAALGHEVAIFMPYYPMIMDTNRYKSEIVKTELLVKIGEKEKWFAVRKYIGDHGVSVYFIEHNEYFGRPHLYGENNNAYSDNGERFIFFSQAVLLAIKSLGIKFDIIHNHDWQTGLVPVYLRNDDFFKNTKKIFTIHNIEYQGIFDKSIMEISNIPWSEFTMQKIEFFDELNCLKAGIVYSDVVTTVSETYAKEISSNSVISKKLDSVLRQVDLRGIINGIDYKVWNPETDKKIVKNYSVEDLTNKKACKKDLIKTKGPVLAIVSRFVKAKGFDVIRASLESILNIDENISLVVLGTGEAKYEKFFEYLQMRYPERVLIKLKFDADFAHKIYAGSDIFLMPSESEACGLAQMISFRYGVVPVVNPVGGLFDTVTKNSGFLMTEYSAHGFYDAVKRALDLYANKRKWNILVKKNMAQDFSWKNSAKAYLEVYK